MNTKTYRAVLSLKREPTLPKSEANERKRQKNSVYPGPRPKASVSLIVGCSTETTSGSTRPPIIETEVWGPFSVRVQWPNRDERNAPRFFTFYVFIISNFAAILQPPLSIHLWKLKSILWLTIACLFSSKIDFLQSKQTSRQRDCQSAILNWV